MDDGSYQQNTDELTEQGGLLPTDMNAAVLQACYNLYGDVVATASSSGVVQVQKTKIQTPHKPQHWVADSWHQLRTLFCHPLSVQVWEVHQGGWRLLHTQEVRPGVGSASSG